MHNLFHTHGKLAYQKMGTGRETVLIFHGFGQSFRDMLAFDQLREPGQKFLYIDLFYHGKSHWANATNPLTKSVWKEIIFDLQKQEDFQDFHLIGYSMGGKFSLFTFELLSDQVKSFTLLAPDGIKTGLWYSMSSYPNYFHPIFKRVVFKPQRFFGIMEGLNSAGLAGKSLVKFVQTQMETRSKRAQAYFVWKVFGGIQLQLGQIIRLARKKNTPITLFIGEFDKMVSSENLERFSSKIPQLQKIILPVGHGGLIEAAANFLRSKKN